VNTLHAGNGSTCSCAGGAICRLSSCAAVGHRLRSRRYHRYNLRRPIRSLFEPRLPCHATNADPGSSCCIKLAGMRSSVTSVMLPCRRANCGFSSFTVGRFWAHTPAFPNNVNGRPCPAHCNRHHVSISRSRGCCTNVCMVAPRMLH